jgi:integrase
VSAILGHASLSTTMDLYVHPDFSEKKKAIERMARMVRV